MGVWKDLERASDSHNYRLQNCMESWRVRNRGLRRWAIPSRMGESSCCRQWNPKYWVGFFGCGWW